MRSNDPWEEEEREFPLGQVSDFIATEEKFVICLDTLGQDREFTEDQRRFVLNTVQEYRKIWEAEQKDNLTRDRDQRLALTRPVGDIDVDDDAGAQEDKPDPL
jgi:hypothetical protein